MLLFYSFVPGVCQAQQTRYVVLISIDGLRPDFYLDPSWGASTLMKLKSGGVYAKGIKSVFPSVTYPAHATLVTGALPARHGVYYNEPFVPDGELGRWYWEENWIKIPTLWDAVHKAGLTSGAVWWPVSVGGPIDHCMPEVWSLDRNEDKSEAVRKHTLPTVFFAELEREATGKLTSDDFNSDYLKMDEKIGKAAGYLIRRYKPNLLAVHFACVDHFQHVEGRDGVNVKKAVVNADKAIAEILASINSAGIGDSIVILITGDHGFADIHTSIAPNVWLAQNGIITSNKGRKEWSAIFHTAGASAFLYLKNKDDKRTLEKVRTVLSQLPDSTKKLFRIMERDELDKLNAAPEAVLALSPVSGVNLKPAFEGNAVMKTKGGTHGYVPDLNEMQTGFIASGKAINIGMLKTEMGIEDIAPIIGQLLHLDFRAPDGKLPDGIIKR